MFVGLGVSYGELQVREVDVSMAFNGKAIWRYV